MTVWGAWSKPNSNWLGAGLSYSWSRVTNSSDKAVLTITAHGRVRYHWNDLQKWIWTNALSSRADRDFLNNHGTNGNTTPSEFTIKDTDGDVVRVTYTYNYGSNEYGSSPGRITIGGRISGAYNGATPSVSTRVTIPTRPILKPVTPGGTHAERISDSKIKVSWGRNSSAGRPVTKQRVIRYQWINGSGRYDNGTRVANVSGKADHWTDTGVDPNGVYYYHVQAGNDAGWSSESINGDSRSCNTSPKAPQRVRANVSSDGDTIKLSVELPNSYTDNNGGLTYDIERSVNGDAYSPLKSGVTSFPWVDNATGAGTNQYRVRARSDKYMNNLTSGWVTSNQVSTIVPPLQPTDLMPDGESLDLTEDQTFTFIHHDGGDGADMSRFQFRIEPNTPPAQVNIAQNAQFFSIAEQIHTERNTSGGGSANLAVDTAWSERSGTSLKISGGDSVATSAYVIGGYGSSVPGESLSDWQGKTVTVSATLHIEEVQPDSVEDDPNTPPRAIAVGLQPTGGGPSSGKQWNFSVDQAPNEPGTYRLSTTFTLPAPGTYGEWFIRLLNGSMEVPVWWDSLVIEEGSSDGSWVTPETVTVDSSTPQYVLPGGSWPNGDDYLWWVRDVGVRSVGYGPWSAVATITGSARPVVTITQPKGEILTGHLLVKWQYSQEEGLPQAFARVVLKQDDGTELEEVSVQGEDSQVELSYYAHNHQQYTLELIATSAYGVESLVATSTFTINLPIPASLTVTPEYQPTTGTMLLSLAADAPLPYEQRTNYVTNPAMRSTNGTVDVRTNYFPDPFFEHGTGGWVDDSLGTWRQVASPDGDGYALKVTRTAESGALMTQFNPQPIPDQAVGTPLTYSCQVWVPSGTTSGGTLRASGTAINAANSVGPDYSIVDQWQEVSVTVTYSQTTGSAGPNFYGPFEQGDSVYFRGGCFEIGTPVVLPPFSGDDNSQWDYNTTPSWSGTPGSSASVLSGPQLGGQGWGAGPQTWFKWQAADGESAHLFAPESASSTIIWTDPVTASPGQVWSDAIHVDESGSGSLTVGISQYDSNNNQIGSIDGSTVGSGQRSVLDGATLVADTAQIRLRVTQSSVQPGEVLTISKAIVEQEATVGPYFDGSTPDTEWQYDWSGTPDSSSSTATFAAEAETVAASIERSVDGGRTWTMLAQDQPVPVDFIDPLPTVYGENMYHLIPISAEPAYGEGTDIIVATPSGVVNGEGDLRAWRGAEKNWVFVNYGDSFQKVLRSRSNPSTSQTNDPQNTSNPFFGKRWPTAQFGQNKESTVAVKVTSTYPLPGARDLDTYEYDSTPEEWDEASMDATIICYRDYRGRRWFGYLDGSVDFDDVRPGQTDLSFTVKRSQFTERWV